MKRFFNIFLSLVIIAFIAFLPACSNNEDDNDQSLASEEYYLALGYHSITFDKFSIIVYDNANNDKAVIEDNKIMLPHNSKFSISFNAESNTDFVSNNSNFVNFKTGKILSAFTDGTKIYDIYNNSITLKNDLNISAIFEDFKTLGVAIFPMTNDLNEPPALSGKIDSVSTINSNLLYYYSKDGSYDSFANNTSQIVYKTAYDTTATLIADNKFELEICLEIFFDTICVNAYLILQDNSNNYYFYEKDFNDDFINNPLVFDELSNSISNINKITLSLSYDLSTKIEY